MRKPQLFLPLCQLLQPAHALGRLHRPDDRPLTDPKSVVSASNAAARPAPIDDLYYTRSVFAPAWSPDGNQIVFVSDLACGEPQGL
jgi:hypothetical protein